MANTPTMLLDCLIIGGGAAGLTAAIYLARFRRDTLLIDADRSRLSMIPTSHNYPGFPQGVRGKELHDRLKAQAGNYDVQVMAGTVTNLIRTEQGYFKANAGDKTFIAKTVVLATGSTDVAPNITGFDEALKNAVLRYCPICDGFEAIGKKVAVLGNGTHGVRESLFIRHYATDLTLISPTTRCGTTKLQINELTSYGIKVVDGDIAALVEDNGQIFVHMQNGAIHAFEILYSALGLSANNALAKNLGLARDEDGQIRTDKHMQSSMSGVYAIGDVAEGLNQISVATGQAAIAATAIHNYLCVDNRCNTD